MTAQRRAEALLRKTEAQFLQAQKMDAVGRLAAGIAHDFNNLLSIILSYTAMLIADDSLPEAIRSDITEIDHAGTRAGDLTRRLLMFSRQDVVEPRVVDVNTSLTSMDKMLQRLLGEDVHLVCSYEPALGSVFLDPSQLDQILINLAVNARDAMPGGGKLSIETANVVLDDAQARERGGIPSGSYVMIAVRDDGAGMDAVTQSRIFDPFFTTKERGRGTGLGLSTVFGIIERCRGGIWVASEVGVGSSFEVYLPRVAEPADSAIGQQRTESASPALHGDETILLVEDDAELRAVARTMLRKHGYSVIDASGGEGALRQWAAHGPKIDLLLTDVVMPQMSGPELARRLMIARPTLKVLCMSGYTDDAIFRQEGAVRGMAYLQKPLTLGSLLLKVRQVLDAS
jgi:nitrogen-specific signal transduction histidine kinase